MTTAALPRRLDRALRNGSCALFVGSGLSAQIRRSDGRPLPTWGALLLELLELATLDHEPVNRPDEVRKMIEDGRLLEAAQVLQDQLSGAALGEYFQVIFGDPAVRPGPNHRLIPQMPLRAVLTSNYDRLVEGAYALARDGWEPPAITPEDLIGRPCPLRNDEPFVFKLHGDYRRMPTIVLGSRDYQERFHHHPLYRHFLERVFSSCTVVFVGFGGSDPDLDEILNKLSTLYHGAFEPHYLVLPRGRFTSTEKERLLRDKRLSVIEYESTPDHAQLAAILKEMVVSGAFPHVAQGRRLRILVSAHQGDYKIVAELCAFLESQEYGYSQIDVSEQPTSAWLQELEVKLTIADCVLHLVTPLSRSEFDSVATWAGRQEVHLIPLVVDGVQLPRVLQTQPFFRVPNAMSDNRYSGLGVILADLDRARHE